MYVDIWKGVGKNIPNNYTNAPQLPLPEKEV
jgi:hypothetical protein